LTEVDGSSRSRQGGSESGETQTWLVRLSLGRDSTTGRSKWLSRAIHRTRRDAASLLTEPLGTGRGGKLGRFQIGTMAQESIPRALHFEFPAAAREATMVPASAMLVATIVEQVVR
jgi:hypothetical protein